jgi:hypothetical protein
MKKLILIATIDNGVMKTSIKIEGIETNGEVIDILGRARDVELLEMGKRSAGQKNERAIEAEKLLKEVLNWMVHEEVPTKPVYDAIKEFLGGSEG